MGKRALYKTVTALLMALIIAWGCGDEEVVEQQEGIPAVTQPPESTLATGDTMATTTAMEQPELSMRRTAPTIVPGGAGRGRFSVQVSSWKTRNKAERLRTMLENDGYPAYVIEADIPYLGHFYRVRVGPFDSMEEANELAVDIQSRFVEQFPDFWIDNYRRQ